MSRFRLILAGCLAFIGICGAHAEDIGDVARAAVRHTNASDTSTVLTRQNNNSTNTSSNSRLTNQSHQSANIRGRTTTAPRTSGIVERVSTSDTRAGTTNNVIQRTASGNVVSRQAANTTRGALTTAAAARATTRTIAPTNSTLRQQTRTVSRAATTDNTAREEILSRNYSKCKTVFFECMDEFCANKDAQLKRCACSSRINEFDSVKKQLAAAEEKMLDFSQRLLTVSMEKEDAAALSVATEGETAYLATKDKSDSKKTLDEIAKKLNTSFNTSNFDSNLNVLSWSLNADSAFDSVDSLMGASTTAKSGTALYSAALPVCREMAAEVCSEFDLSLAESGYQATIEQDCNTVAKTYQAQVDQARAKVKEGSALLDMSRLDIYQKRNSDDILTCKKKMLDMLTDSTVCGDELGKCLDVTGQYIDPSTGEAFLTKDLANLGSLITRPTDNYTWSKAPGNTTFVSFLNSKRKFLEPAMEQCQDIADNVWNAFIDDALAQIKLAQDKKLEDVRQSCTTLTAQCLSDASESITQFDARALSTFGISADTTANAMCANVMNACTTLLATIDTNEDWATGMSGIATSTTYTAMMQTCRQVGQACIIQVCQSSSGNFGLCESIANSTNRKAIINHTACWDEVKDCIRSTGEESIANIVEQLHVDTGMDLNFYSQMYVDGADMTTQASDSFSAGNCIVESNDGTCIYDLCVNECAATGSLFECRVCRLAENLWGNCEVSPTTDLSLKNSHNKIKLPRDTNNPTLLYWFATNTGTNSALDSCRDTTCGVGYTPVPENGLVTCKDNSLMCYSNDGSSGGECDDNNKIFPLNSARCQCCAVKAGDNCCTDGHAIDGDVENREYCVSSDTSQVITQPFVVDGKTHVLICDGGTMDEQNGNPHCSGTLVDVVISNNGFHYSSPTRLDYVTETFTNGGVAEYETQRCTYDAESDNWGDCPTPNQWSVKFNN